MMMVCAYAFLKSAMVKMTEPSTRIAADDILAHWIWIRKASGRKAEQGRIRWVELSRSAGRCGL